MSMLFALLSAPGFAATISVDPSGGADHTSLSAAIAAASSGDAITLAAGSYTGPFNTRGKNLTITGAGVSGSLLSAGAAQTVFTVERGETVSLSGLTLYGALQGLEVRGSTVSLTSVHITDHSGRTPGSGAGVYDGGNLTVRGCVFARNEASSSYSGGGVYVSGSTFAATNSTFRDNAAGQGGALYIDDAVAELTDVTLDGNIASTHGGGIRARYAARLDATRLTVINNTAGGRGGGLSGYQADIFVIDGAFSGNRSGTAGGAIHLDQTSTAAATITAEVTANTAETTGGGIHADTLSLGFSGILSDNAAGDDNDGGGLYAIAADIRFERVDLLRNSAGVGGGVYSFYGGSLDFEDITVDENTSTFDGGAIYTESPLTLLDAMVSGNISGTNGGALAVVGTTADLSEVAFDGNSAGAAGGAIYANDTPIFLSGAVRITQNSAVYGGGIAATGTGTETIDFGGGQVISDNIASGEGGGLFLTNLGSAVLDGSTLSGNDGGAAGGGARVADLGSLSAIGVLVTSNIAQRGAGFHLTGVAAGETAWSVFRENVAATAGGGILAQNPAGSHPLHHLQLLENASAAGAALYLINDTAADHPLSFSDIVANTGPTVSLEQSPGARVRHVCAAHNAGVAFAADATSATTAVFEYNNTWNNTDDYGGALPVLVGSNGNVAVDPDYAAVTPDGTADNELLIPGSNSRMRDMGDPSIIDLDGSPADPGHLGGPDAIDQDYDEDGRFISDGDCDDASASVYPGAAEVWYDGEDNDCLGGDDSDADGDGHPIGDDCDDTDSSVNPDATDDTMDGVDQDCDGNDGPTGGTDGESLPDESGEALDLDRDGSPESEDCDDSEARAFPGNIEACADGLDNDCDGYVDDFDSDCIGKAGDRACSAAPTTSVSLLVLVLLGLSLARRRED